MSLGRERTGQLLPHGALLQILTFFFFCHLARISVFLVSGGKTKTTSPLTTNKTNVSIALKSIQVLTLHVLGRSVKNHYGHHLRGDQLCQSLPSSVKQKDNYSVNGVWCKTEGAGVVSRFVFQFKTAWGESPRWVTCSPAQFGLLPCAPFNFLPVAGSLCPSEAV